jgi:alpha-glucuronidase
MGRLFICYCFNHKKETMKKIFFKIMLVFLLFVLSGKSFADDGYRLWLKYDLISNASLLKEYRTQIKGIMIGGNSTTIKIAENELTNGLEGLLGQSLSKFKNINDDGIVIIGINKNIRQLQRDINNKLSKLGNEGFVISNTSINRKKALVITANSDIGVLYGVFHFLRLLQTNQNISSLDIVSSPKTKLRMLNHWDMLNGVHEYSGLLSIWDWHTLPEYIKPEYIDYARANASIGINAIVPNNVDADPRFLIEENLIKLAALADLFRSYGIKLFLCPNFSSPIRLAGMKTADPFVPEVREWWKKKVSEIYKLIPDFGGFLVKANSEDEPGPGDFNKTQADGANMFAEALKLYGGLVIWRTFVYRYNPEDRAREAYDIFKPLDGKFADNAVLQVKNGPLDFSPREPFSPLFGAMPNTPLMMEVDITMGGLGKDVYLGFMASMWREALRSDTYAKGEGSTVAKVIDGSLENNKIGGMAGVANIYRERDWTGNLFGQSNWYTFGRLAWDYNITSEQIADEWIRMTFSNDAAIINPIKKMMMESIEDIVNFQDPLGLNMLMGWGGFRGPWTNNSEHTNWNSPYYHRADSVGIGFDRTESGSKAVDQYFQPVAEKFNSLKTCPVKFLLWFHHVPWSYKLKSGNTIWEEICYHYYKGVKGVKEMQNIWTSLEGKIDKERFDLVGAYLKIEYEDAINWRDGCVLYFQTFSHMRIPEGLEKPEHDLEYYILAMSRDKIGARKMAKDILQTINKN